MTDLSNLEAVVYERIGPVALIRMNRPERLNALSSPMHRDVIACYDEVSANPEIRAAVVTGTGRFFCAGRDIKEFLEAFEQKKLRPIEDPDHPQFGYQCTNYVVTKPLIGAVQGAAFGGGLSLLVSLDMIVMADDAYIADGHARPNIGGLACLLRYLPPMVGCEVAMTDRRLTPEECLRWGLVNYVVPKEQVVAKAVEIGMKIASMGPDAIRMIKQASIDLKRSLGQIIDEESREVRRLAARDRLRTYEQNPDLVEGMKAFAEKREAEYANPV